MKTNTKPFVDDFRVKLNISDEVKAATPELGKGIIVTIDATRGGYVNRNFYFYSLDGMKRSVKTWNEPYNKPMLIHHRMNDDWEGTAVDPIGRIIGAEFIQDGEQGFIRLKAQITDPDAIAKVMDGRYLTVSTSQRPAGPVRCSICGNDLLQDRCDHNRGTKYVIEGDEDKGIEDEIKLCYFEFSDLEYRECSPVNEPADQDDNHAATIISWTAMDSIGDTMPTTEVKCYSKACNAADGIVELATDELAPVEIPEETPPDTETPKAEDDKDGKPVVPVVPAEEDEESAEDKAAKIAADKQETDTVDLMSIVSSTDWR